MTLKLNNRQELHSYLLASIEGLERACAQEKTFEVAFLLRDWAASVSSMVSEGTALRIGKGIDLINDLLNFRGGVACSGAAYVFIEALRACGVPAASYYYGFNLPKGRFSHLTTVFIHQASKKSYMMDAYLCYHFEDPGGNLLPLCRMLRMTEQKEYDQIVRIDGIATRATVCRASDECHGIYIGGKAPPRERRGDLTICHGRQMSMTNFLLAGARVEMFKKVYGNRPIDEILLDCLFSNAQIGPGLGPLGQKLVDILAGKESYAQNQ